MKPCWYVDAFGNKCKNRSGNVEEISKLVWEEINKEYERLINEISDGTNNDNSKIELLIKKKNAQLNKFKSALEKIDDEYELGNYTREKWLERTSKWNSEIDKVTIEINELESKKLNNNEIRIKEDKIKALKYIIDNLPKETDSTERNKLYKMVIEKINWTRIGDKNAILSIDFY